EYWQHQNYDQAIYPDVITYAYKDGNAVDMLREVRFFRTARTDFWDTSNQYHLAFFENQRIWKIEVKLSTRLVRKYEFTHSYSDNGHLLLNSIRMYGSDGTSTLTPLPDFTFTHDSSTNVLTS